ncbi:MAG: ABC transporter ATP-binding protein [Actinomycetota bacterium]|nr:ABC transporter ATP-binding protein [Actinomycetota bacterium]
MSSIRASDVVMVFETRHGRTLALDHVSVEVPDGHFACLVGASGCGKSTLLNIMGGLLRPTSGTITLAGRPVEGAGADRGMVFQTYTLYPWLRVRENIEFGPMLKGMTKGERRRISDRLLAEMGLSDFARAYPKELSGGMKQRVAIARALANEPAVLLMDEPFGALDALTRSAAQRFLTEIWEHHRRTIAFVTHDIDEAIFLGDTVFVMSPRPGRIREIIEVDIARPRSLDDIGTARFAELKHRILSLIYESEDGASAAGRGTSGAGAGEHEYELGGRASPPA